MNRICIYPKDIQLITGKSERQSRNILTTIKKELNKHKHQAVTLQEFCHYMGINPTSVEKYMR